MAEKLSIEIFRRKDAEDFTKSLADPESRTAVGSGAAMTAAVAAAYLYRAAALCAKDKAEDERLAWLVRNSEILRTYMVNLIDEDVKCRGPLRRAISEGDPRKIEAAHQPAAAIANEIVNMMTQCLDLLAELKASADGEAMVYVRAAAEFAMAAIRACMRVCIYWGDLSTEDTRRYVIRRENELQLQEIDPLYKRVIDKLEA